MNLQEYETKLSIIIMMNKEKIRACFLRGFYHYPQEQSIDEIVWHNVSGKWDDKHRGIIA